MKAPWKFFVMMPVGFLAALAGYWGLFCVQLGVPTETSRWCFELARKKTIAAQTRPTPKLLLVGGSATLFGISARLIEERTAVPTVNFGSYAALSPHYILHLARGVLRPGDTVLLGLEYELFDYGSVRDTVPNDFFVDYIVARDPAYWSQLPLYERFTLSMLMPWERLKRGLKNVRKAEASLNMGQIYRLENLNAWGDQSHHIDAKKLTDREFLLGTRPILVSGLPDRPKAFPILAEFCDWARSNRIQVLATFPNICAHEQYLRASADRGPRQIRDFFAARNVPVLGEARDAMLPPDDFFDTYYHPTEEAARARTARLIPHLVRHLKP